MKKDFKNKVFSFVSKKNIKRFMLLVYCIAPLLVFAVGFSAWNIIGHETGSTTGSFVASGIINSYDYIEFAGDNNTLGNINLYPSSFIENGERVDSANIQIKYTLKIGACRELLSKEGSGTTLYADFTLMFLQGNPLEEFYYNLNVEVEESGSETTYVNVTGQDKKDTSHTTSLEITPGSLTENNSNEEITLTFTYTLKFAANGTITAAQQYQELYGKIVDAGNLMVDVRITDLPPNT